MDTVNKNALQKLSEKLRYGLIWQAIRNRIEKMGLDIRPFYLMQEDFRNHAVPKIKNDDNEFIFCELSREEVNQKWKYAPGYSLEKLMELFDEGKKCYGVMHKGEIVAFMWVDFKNWMFTGRSVPIKENEAYLTHMYTLESYRGRNIAPFLRYHCMQALSQTGKDIYYSVTEYFNTSAARYKKKLDSKKILFGISVILFKKHARFYILKRYKLNHQ